VFGLDAAPPSLLFRDFLPYLPNFQKVLKHSIYGEMRSCDPPITVPAWMVMMTGREPGELGLYGFRHRKGYSYKDIVLPSSRDVKVDRVWDILGKNNYKSFIMGVPPSYPPYKINGWLISCFLTPDDTTTFTYPLTLKYEVKKIVDRYIFDVPFRREDRDWVLDNINLMTDIHSKVALKMAKSKPWDFFMYMEIGLDRVQHAFWKYMDRSHVRYEEHPRYSKAILNYYIKLDKILGEILEVVGDSDILIVSDHGAKKMDGAFAINEWLMDRGYLKVRDRDIRPRTRLSDVDIDWSETIAWGWGGYYGRLFINVEGREESGIVSWDEYNDILSRLAKEVSSIRGPNKEVWNNIVYRPRDLYRELRGNPPDLMIYFDDLNWRSAGTIGYDTPYLEENDTGPDDAVHDYNGIFIWYSKRFNSPINIGEVSIYDIAPTILGYYDLTPPDVRGNVIEEIVRYMS